MIYQQNDFSEIHSWNELPDIPGIYITDHCNSYESFLKIHHGESIFFDEDFFSFFDGKVWRSIDSNLELCTCENVGRWFGLKEKP